MTQHRSAGRHSRKAVIGTSILCLLLLVILFDPLPWFADIVSVARIRWELPRAKERWQALDLDSYQIKVKGAIPLTCILEGELLIRAGVLSEVRTRENALIPETPLQTIDPAAWSSSGCPYEDLTVEAMFERLERHLEQVKFFGAPLRVKFDREAGYITEYHFGRASQGGIFGYTISDCCTGFEFSNLSDLPPG